MSIDDLSDRDLTTLDAATLEIIAQIDELLDDARAEFAWHTLEGIRSTIQLTRRVSPGQSQAISNIRSGMLRSQERPAWRRRYEGARPRSRR